MNLSDLAKNAGKLLSNEVSKQTKSKCGCGCKKKTSTSDAIDLISKVASKASSSGFDLSSILSMATDNSDLVGLLGKLGLAKAKCDPDGDVAQKIVKQIKTFINKNITKIDDQTFQKIINKLLSSDSVKKGIEQIAGKGTNTYIKNAISAFIS